MKIKWSKQPILYIIPGIILLWTAYLNYYLGPFYMRGIDPEYMYLISGLNCATLDFNYIGHVDHPGTPLQLITGLFFRIIFLFTGDSDIIISVISDPELYLSLSNLFLTGITFFLILKLGILVYKHTSSLLGALILQSSSFYTGVNAGILSRYSPDRLITMIILLFFVLYVKYLYEKNFSARKFSISSGVLMGAGLLTKFNFFPLLLIPLFIIAGRKNKFYYLLSLSGSALLFFLPISSKFNTLWRTMKEMIGHSGLYGSGDQGIIDTSSFFTNILQVFKSHPSFTIIIVLAIICIMILLLRPGWRSKNREGFLFLLASLFSVLLGLVMTAKHYKGYYALPFLSLIPMILYTMIQGAGRMMFFKYSKHLYVLLFAFILTFPLLSIARSFSGPNEPLHDKKKTEHYLRDHFSPEDYFIISPIWKTTAMVENAMVLGVSYIHHERLFYLDFEQVYPNILTWEGSEKPLKHMRMRDANLEEILLSGKGIYIYSSPGWNAPELCDYLESKAQTAGIHIFRDTTYSNNKIKEHIIRYRNIDGWKRTTALRCGFERQVLDQLISDDGETKLTGSFELDPTLSARGKYSILLDETRTSSPGYTLSGIKQGDRLSSSVKASIAKNDEIKNINIRVEYLDSLGNNVVLNSSPSPGKIHEDWYQIDLYGAIESQPVDSSINCLVEYKGFGTVHLDDFTLKAYSQHPLGPNYLSQQLENLP